MEECQHFQDQNALTEVGSKKTQQQQQQQVLGLLLKLSKLARDALNPCETD